MIAEKEYPRQNLEWCSEVMMTGNAVIGNNFKELILETLF